MKATERVTRRRFTQTAAAALASAPLAALAVEAQRPNPSPTPTAAPSPREATAPPNPQASPSPQPPSPIAEAYAEVARARFGEHLSREELERVKRSLQGNVRSADALRAVKLNNAEEPDVVFRV
ncbi:MAG: hypothetical protein LC672_02315 [Acidobacteria bacterium]|nr:hypothetical protein [Acidobacteriota bacterium]